MTRTFDFTGDVGGVPERARAVVADGGGDTPESRRTPGSHDAIDKPSWRGGDTVKLVFLVGDAAPHLDYPDDARLRGRGRSSAASAGIKVEPIASSGLDDQGEYVFRQLAQLTGGRFSFLTYGAGGAPDPATRRRTTSTTTRCCRSTISWCGSVRRVRRRWRARVRAAADADPRVERGAALERRDERVAGRVAVVHDDVPQPLGVDDELRARGGAARGSRSPGSGSPSAPDSISSM